MKVNSPNILKFPIIINSHTRYKKLIPILKKNGYFWGGSIVVSLGKDNLEKWEPLSLPYEINKGEGNYEKWLNYKFI